MSEERITARFHPQAWIGDCATEVDAEGEVDFDVTDAILALPLKDVLAIEDDDLGSDYLLRYAKENVPQWILDWGGPFWVEVQEEIEAYVLAKLVERD